MMKKLTISQDYAREFDEKCARVDAHGFLKFLMQKNEYNESILYLLSDVEKVLNTHPYQEINVPYDEKQFNGLITEFFEEYFPSKSAEVAQILDGTHPYFIDEKGKSHINFLPAERGKSSSVGHSNRNSYLEFNVYKNNSISDLIATVHEISHALSGHHKRIVESIRKGGSQKELDALTKDKGFARDCIGEIESNIVERLFIKFLYDKGILHAGDVANLENQQRLSLASEINLIREESEILKKLPCPVTQKSLEKLVDGLAKAGNSRLLERVGKMHDDEKNSAFMFRYVVGRIVATEWITEFLKSESKDNMLKKFCTYWDNTDKADLEVACSHLLEIGPDAVVGLYFLDREEELNFDENEIE